MFEMFMIVFSWFGFSAAIGVGAARRYDRNGVGWFFLSLLISPLLAVAFLLAAGTRRAVEVSAQQPHPASPHPASALPYYVGSSSAQRVKIENKPEKKLQLIDLTAFAVTVVAVIAIIVIRTLTS